jgi:hypothetical protein
MTPAEFRMQVTLTTLRAIEEAVRKDSNLAGEHGLDTQRNRIDNAIRIYTAQLIAGAQK